MSFSLINNLLGAVKKTVRLIVWSFSRFKKKKCVGTDEKAMTTSGTADISDWHQRIAQAGSVEWITFGEHFATGGAAPFSGSSETAPSGGHPQRSAADDNSSCRDDDAYPMLAEPDEAPTEMSTPFFRRIIRYCTGLIPFTVKDRRTGSTPTSYPRSTEIGQRLYGSCSDPTVDYIPPDKVFSAKSSGEPVHLVDEPVITASPRFIDGERSAPPRIQGGAGNDADNDLSFRNLSWGVSAILTNESTKKDLSAPPEIVISPDNQKNEISRRKNLPASVHKNESDIITDAPCATYKLRRQAGVLLPEESNGSNGDFEPTRICDNDGTQASRDTGSKRPSVQPEREGSFNRYRPPSITNVHLHHLPFTFPVAGWPDLPPCSAAHHDLISGDKKPIPSPNRSMWPVLPDRPVLASGLSERATLQPRQLFFDDIEQREVVWNG